MLRRYPLKLIFVAPKFRLSRVQNGEKRAKNEKLHFAKKNFSFLRVYELDIGLGVNTDRKKKCGEGVLAKNFFEF